MLALSPEPRLRLPALAPPQGHCEQCLPDRMGNEEKKQRFPSCLVCHQACKFYMRIYMGG